MAIVPTLEEEDAKRPHREREGLVLERIRIVNKMKAVLIQFGVRNFKPTLRKAPERLDAVRTPEGVPLPLNTRDMLRRYMERKRLIDEQIKSIEQTRLERIEQDRANKGNAMVLMLTQIVGVGVETAELLVREILSRQFHNRKAVARYAGLPGHRTKADRNAGRSVFPGRAISASAISCFSCRGEC